ncbi:MAG: RNA-binding protein [Candidatus Omnitrophica bacterium]|nr:RNA-binding protein [Candidatus Omnitrophota bacterium]MCB9748088.1 RNA-binding protein [Candidatus Omnitrophota bacterium]
MNIYIGNFSKEVTEADLKEAFEAFGQVDSVVIVKDRYSGESRGFGFVEMPSKREAGEAIDSVVALKGKMVVVNEARPRESDRSGKSRRSGNKNSGGHRRY